MQSIRETSKVASVGIALCVAVGIVQGCGSGPGSNTSPSEQSATQMARDDDGNTGVSRFKRSDPRALAGFADIVFVGTVTEKLGTRPAGAIPSTQYAAQIVESIKGGNSGTATLNQIDAGEDGSANNALEVGTTYLFAGRYSSKNGWFNLISGSLGATKLDASEAQVLRTNPGSDATDPPEVKRMRDAVANQLPFKGSGPRPAPPTSQRLTPNNLLPQPGTASSDGAPPPSS